MKDLFRLFLLAVVIGIGFWVAGFIMNLLFGTIFFWFRILGRVVSYALLAYIALAIFRAIRDR